MGLKRWGWCGGDFMENMNRYSPFYMNTQERDGDPIIDNKTSKTYRRHGLVAMGTIVVFFFSMKLLKRVPSKKNGNFWYHSEKEIKVSTCESFHLLCFIF
jgi:hypothetical protein